MPSDTAKTLHCSFCTKRDYEVRRLIGEGDVAICDECIALCVAILDEEGVNVASQSDEPRSEPNETELMLEAIRRHITK